MKGETVLYETEASSFPMFVGVSPNPSRYRIHVARGEIGLKCGPDIILNGLRSNLDAEANCPVCQGLVRFKITDTKLEQLEPSEAIVHVVETVEGPGRLCVTCEASHIFDREECLHEWLGKYHGIPGSIYRLQEYMEHVKAVETRETPN